MRIRKLVIFLSSDFSFEKSFNSELESCTDCRFFLVFYLLLHSSADTFDAQRSALAKISLMLFR